ncbi:MAG: phosphoribosylaminoimidazolesuccinocarboxamide synthase [Pontimonas sp.]|nr:phosphoribosylaminoimidazolesuccinocarboxamide synthase [Pontimonas sp.]
MTTLADWKPLYSGKVRELYIPVSASSGDDADRLLIVASDRISAFDHILDPEVQGKGEILTALSAWWFSQLSDVPNHLTGEAPPAELASRSMVVTPLRMFPVECVVRGYLAGSGWKEYVQSQTVGGIPQPAGLSEGDRLPEVLFTPATKAAIGDHDENITYAQMVAIVGDEVASKLREMSLSIYGRASEIARSRGVILADTKFEFGVHPCTGEIALGDEVLTSDSSRYWDGELYTEGGIHRLDSFDKQLVRNWLSAHWSGEGAPPRLPDELVAHTKARYLELYSRLTGQAFTVSS